MSRRARPNDPLATWCQARIEGVCEGRAIHRHHILRRSQGGSDGASNTVDICNGCHHYIHGHPAWSYENGWLRRRATGTELERSRAQDNALGEP
jgi:hypothetical protein